MKEYRTISQACGVAYILVPKCASNSIIKAVKQSDDRRKPHQPIDFAFTFVRHPLDRLISAYVEKVQTGKINILMPNHKRAFRRDMSLEEFVNFIYTFRGCEDKLNNHFCPQSTITGLSKLNFIGKLENIADDWKILLRRGLPDLKHLHKTPHKTYQEMSFGKSFDKAVDFYRRDMEQFNYAI